MIPFDSGAPGAPTGGDNKREHSLPKELRQFLTLSFTLVLLSFGDAFVRWPLQGKGTAFAGLFLTTPLCDLMCFRERYAHLHTSTFYSFPGQIWNYPAPSAFIYRILYIPKTDLGVWELYMALWATAVLISGTLFVRALRRRGIGNKEAIVFTFCTVILSWPIYFSLQRGNIEGFLSLGLAASLVLYIRRHWRLAAVGIGIVAAFKMYPLLFLGMYLPTRRYRAFLQGLLAALITTYIGLAYLGSNLKDAARFVVNGIRAFLAMYSGTFLGFLNGYDHSIWALIKPLLHRYPLLILHLVPFYTLTAGVLAVWFFFARVWSAPRFNQLLALCTLMVLLPATSFDYTLQALYIPFAWLCLLVVRASRQGKVIPGSSLLMVCFSLLFGPLTFIRGKEHIAGGQVKTLVLLGLLVISSRCPIWESSADGARV